MAKTSSAFYQSHLDRVSRSFAFCIRQLPEPLRGWVGLSYLLCRVLDTIEDAPWSSSDRQFEAYALFDSALADAESVSRLKDLRDLLPADVPEAERLLMADAPELFKDLYELPAAVNEVMRELVRSMSLGMQHFSRQKSGGGGLRLRSLCEVNQYCFFVAGVVGELLANLLHKVEPRFALTQGALVRAHHFGQFLQKVNLLKDQVGDERVGRHLIPSREEVEESSKENAARAFDFLLEVPAEQIEFRRFCAWSLFLGLESLRVARQSVLTRVVEKVTRPRAEELLARVNDALSDEGALRRLFHAACERLGWSFPVRKIAAGVELPGWLPQIYRGPLDTESLNELGLSC